MLGVCWLYVRCILGVSLGGCWVEFAWMFDSHLV